MSKEDEKISNRLEVFLTNLKYHLPTTCLIGVLLFAFFIPIIVLFAVQSYMVAGLGDNADVNTIYNIYNTCNLILIPLLMLFSVGLAGCGQIIKNLCWNNVVHIADDFKKGIRQNSIQCIIVAAIIGVINFAAGLNYIVLNTPNETYKIVLSTISVFLPILLLPSLIFIVNQIFIYNQKLFKVIRYGLQLYVVTIFKTLLVFILSLSPYLLGIIKLFSP